MMIFLPKWKAQACYRSVLTVTVIWISPKGKSWRANWKKYHKMGLQVTQTTVSICLSLVVCNVQLQYNAIVYDKIESIHADSTGWKKQAIYYMPEPIRSQTNQYKKEIKLNSTSSLVNQRASSISFLSTLIPVDTATAKQPIIREEGIGHGWQQTYWTWPTLTPASSSTSLRTASSIVSPNQKGQRASSWWKYFKQLLHPVLSTDSKDLKLPKTIIYRDLVHRLGHIS